MGRPRPKRKRPNAGEADELPMGVGNSNDGTDTPGADQDAGQGEADESPMGVSESDDLTLPAPPFPNEPPPGKIVSKGHGQVRASPVQSGVDALRRTLGLSPDVPVDRLCASAADHIAQLRDQRKRVRSDRNEEEGYVVR